MMVSVRQVLARWLEAEAWWRTGSSAAVKQAPEVGSRLYREQPREVTAATTGDAGAVEVLERPEVTDAATSDPLQRWVWRVEAVRRSRWGTSRAGVYELCRVPGRDLAGGPVMTGLRTDRVARALEWGGEPRSDTSQWFLVRSHD